MAILSGSRGTLHVGQEPLTPVTGWRLERFRRSKSYTANDTGGWRKRVAGVADCLGRFEIQATDQGRLPIEEGDAVTLTLHLDDTGLRRYEVPARIERIRLSVDITAGGPIAYVVEFAGNGVVLGPE